MGKYTGGGIKKKKFAKKSSLHSRRSKLLFFYGKNERLQFNYFFHYIHFCTFNF